MSQIVPGTVNRGIPDKVGSPLEDDEMNDKAADYQYCMVLNASEDGTTVDKNGKEFISVMRKNGLEVYLFFGSIKKMPKRVFCLIKASLDRLRSFADEIGETSIRFVLLDSNKQFSR